MIYSSFDIAKKILEFAERDGIKVEPMKLLKLVYIAHGWYLGFHNKPLIGDDVQAWKYGPVIPRLYHVIKRFGIYPVDPLLIDLYATNVIDKKTDDFLEGVWNVYRNMSGIELSARTHKDGTAWKNTFDGSMNRPMSNENIMQHYKQLIAEVKDQPKSAFDNV